jgi:hypothetical protein
MSNSQSNPDSLREHVRLLTKRAASNSSPAPNPPSFLHEGHDVVECIRDMVQCGLARWGDPEMKTFWIGRAGRSEKLFRIEAAGIRRIG